MASLWNALIVSLLHESIPKKTNTRNLMNRSHALRGQQRGQESGWQETREIATKHKPSCASVVRNACFFRGPNVSPLCVPTFRSSGFPIARRRFGDLRRGALTGLSLDQRISLRQQ